MYKFKIKLLYNKEQFCCTKTELLDFMLPLSLPDLGIIAARLKSNTYPGDIPVNIIIIQC